MRRSLVRDVSEPTKRTLTEPGCTANLFCPWKRLAAWRNRSHGQTWLNGEIVQPTSSIEMLADVMQKREPRILGTPIRSARLDRAPQGPAPHEEERGRNVEKTGLGALRIFIAEKKGRGLQGSQEITFARTQGGATSGW